MFQRAAGGFGDRCVFLGGVSFGEQQGLGLEEAGATQDGADIVWVLDSVEHDEPCCFFCMQVFDQLGEGGCWEGVAFQRERLVCCVGFVEFIDRLFGGYFCKG